MKLLLSLKIKCHVMEGTLCSAAHSFFLNKAVKSVCLKNITTYALVLDLAQSFNSTVNKAVRITNTFTQKRRRGDGAIEHDNERETVSVVIILRKAVNVEDE